MSETIFDSICKMHGFRLKGRALRCVACFGVLWAAVAQGQVVTAPRYTGGVEAPVKQLNLPPVPAAITPHGTVVENVVVRVNDQIISRSDVERSQQQLQEEAAQNNLSGPELALRERDNLRDLIDQQLLLSRAKSLGLNADTDVIRRLDEIRKQNKLDSLEELEKAAKSQGVSFEDFKAQIRNQLLTQMVVRDEVGRKLQASEADEKKYYAEHAKEFEQPEQIQLSEILVPLPDTAAAPEIAQAEAKANGLKAELAKGADFAEVAKKNSGGPTAAQGGELGLFKRGALAKVLEDQTFGLKVGESTEPIRTRQGFVILKVTQHDPAGPAPLKEVEPKIQEALYIQAVQPALRAYLTKLREESYIDLQPGFVDSGATAQETKPVFTAYSLPPVKKKKVKAKARFDRNGRLAGTTGRPVVSSPDTTGGRTLTGTEAKSNVDPGTGLATLAPAKTANGKAPKHLRREKIRFGQAPREVIPAGTDDVAVGTDADASPTSTVGSGGAAAGTATTGAPASATATGAANSSSAGTETASSADLADNLLTPREPEKKKTRFAAKANEEKEKKVKSITAKQREKIIATPTPASSDEKAAQKTQSAPLGLSGDTSKKKIKKPKRAKGVPKERLQDKPPVVPPVATPIDQTASPALAPTDVAPAPNDPPTVPPTGAPPPATPPPA